MILTQHEINEFNRLRVLINQSPRKLSDMIYCDLCGLGGLEKHRCTKFVRLICACGVEIERATTIKHPRCWPCRMALNKKSVRKSYVKKKRYCLCGIFLMGFKRKYCSDKCQRRFTEHKVQEKKVSKQFEKEMTVINQNCYCNKPRVYKFNPYCSREHAEYISDGRVVFLPGGTYSVRGDKMSTTSKEESTNQNT